MSDAPYKHVNSGQTFGNTVVQPIHSTTEPFVGGQSTITYIGDFADCKTLALYYLGFGYKTEMLQGPQTTLTVTYPYDTLLNTGLIPGNPIWEVIPRDVEQPLLECDDIDPIGSLSTVVKEAIKMQVKNPVLPFIDNVPGIGATDLANAKTVYNLMLTGVESRYIECATVKVTIPAFINYPPTWSSINDLVVLSDSTLIGGWDIPSAIANLMPASSGVFSNNGVTWMWGYLQKRAQVQIISSVKLTLTKEWLYDKWSIRDGGGFGVYPHT